MGGEGFTEAGKVGVKRRFQRGPRPVRWLPGPARVTVLAPLGGPRGNRHVTSRAL